MFTVILAANLLIPQSEFVPATGNEVYDSRISGLRPEIRESDGHSHHRGAPYKFEISSPGQNPWDAQLKTELLQKPLSNGDTVLVSLLARSGKGSLATFSGHLQRTVPSYEYVAGFNLSVGLSWRNFYFPIKIQKDLPANSTELTLHLAARAQVVEIADIKIWNLGQNADTTKIPANPLSYEGQSPDSTWRTRASQMIEKNRKANFVVNVIDPNGKPVKDAKVEVKMTGHSYPFGSFTDYAPGKQDEVGAKNRETMKRMFNRITVPIYWADWGWEDEKEQKNYLNILDWAKQDEIRMRAHCILYPGYQFFPTRIAKLENDKGAYEKAILDGTKERINVLRKYPFEAIDVVNELVTCTDVERVLGNAITNQVHNMARQAWPKARLVYNDFDIFEASQFGSPNSKKREAVYDRLVADKTQLDQWGWQGHFGESLTGPEEVWRALDHFTSKYKRPIEITEFDIDTRDERGQADYTRDLLTAWFAHPNTVGFTTWGFWEGSMWRPNGAMFRKDWTLKPNGQVWRDLIYKQWWTKIMSASNGKGQVLGRGFLGKYLITVSKGKKVASRTVELAKSGGTYKVTLN